MAARPRGRSPGRRFRHSPRHRLPPHARECTSAQRVSKAPASARHLGANGCGLASVPAIGSATTREHNGSIVLPNRATRGWVDLRDSRRQRADLLSPARRAHDTGESRVAVRGAGSAARGDQHALAIGDKAAASCVLPGAGLLNRPDSRRLARRSAIRLGIPKASARKRSAQTTRLAQLRRGREPAGLGLLGEGLDVAPARRIWVGSRTVPVPKDR